MAWPNDDLTNANLDAGTDDPSLARAELNALLLKVQAILGEVVAGNTIAQNEVANVFTALQKLNGGWETKGSSDTVNMRLYRTASNAYALRYNDDGAGNQVDATVASWQILFSPAEITIWVRPAGGAYVKVFSADDASKFLDLQGNDVLYDGRSLSRLRGALVTSSVNQTINSGVGTIVSWDTDIYDTDNIHDTVTNNTRLVVPTGVSYVRLYGGVEWGISGTGTHYIYFTRTSGPVYGSVVGMTSDVVGTIGGSTPPIPVNAGDYFEMGVYQDSGNAWLLRGTAYGDNTFFGMEILE